MRVNINHIIPPNLRNKYQWSTKFLIKVEDNFRPNIEIFEHDFTESSLKLSLKYNSAYLVKIYKNNKIKRRNTIQFKFIGNFDI